MVVDKAKIFLVEDEYEIRDLMKLHLVRKGYEVFDFESVETAIPALNIHRPDLVVLDWMLPGISGLEWMKELAMLGFKKPTVLMVTAKSDPSDIVAGLDSGADDYMTKPFDPIIFSARINALLRRKKGWSSEEELKIIKHNDLVLDSNQHLVTYQDKKLDLTPSEFKLLQIMLYQQGKVLTREKLIENIQGEGVNVIGRTVDTHVFGLRKKLGDWGDQIETIRGIGYRVRISEGTNS